MFYDQFKDWASQWPEYVSVVNDNSKSNDARLGAVAAIEFVSQHFKVEEDVLVVAGWVEKRNKLSV